MNTHRLSEAHCIRVGLRPVYRSTAVSLLAICAAAVAVSREPNVDATIMLVSLVATSLLVIGISAAASG